MSGPSLSEQPRVARGYQVVALATVVTGALDYVIASTGVLLPTSQGAGQACIDWRSGDWAIYQKPLYWRLRAQVWTSGTAAPGQTCHVSMFAASPSGANAGAVILGTEVPNIRGASVPLSLGTTVYELTTPTVLAPADGLYVPILHSGAAWAANSGAIVVGGLEVFVR